MKLVNLTPHTINVQGTVLPSEGVARLESCEVLLDELDFDGVPFAVPLYRQKYGEVTGLPEPQPLTVFIVSALVANALKGKRSDLVYPARLVRDAQGRVTGCEGFSYPA